MSADDDVSDDLLDAVLQGRQIDWQREILAASTDPERARLVRNLQKLAEVDWAHRQVRFGGGDPLPFSHWRHLHLIDRIGAGTHGELFRARDESLGQEVALKLYREFPEDVSRRTSVIAEARRLARIRHDNVVLVHGVDVDHGRVGFWMELVAGEDLERILEREGPLDPRRVATIGVALCRALTAAHGANVLHGDIKPTNVICEPKGRVCLVDFGAGRSALPNRAADLHRTGTPLFMAPETLLEGVLTERSDLYSLGALLYHALTRRYPVDAPDLDGLIRVHGERESPPNERERVSGTRLELQRIEVPSRLREVLCRCLSPDPDARFGTALELEEALRAVVASRRSKRRLLAMLGAIALASVLVAVAIRQGDDRPAPSNAGASLAFAGFGLAPNQSDSLLAGSLTTLVRSGLFESSPCRVVSASRTLDLRRRLGDAFGPLTPAVGTQVARTAGATLALVGEVEHAAGDHIAAWQLIETHTGRRVANGLARASLETDVADAVVRAAGLAISKHTGAPAVSSPMPVSGIVTPSDSALREYQRALLDREGHRDDRAYQHLERAVAIDSGFALAHLEMAEQTWTNWNLGRALRCAERAWAGRARLGFRDRLKAEAVLERWRGNSESEIHTYQEILVRWPDDLEAARLATAGLMASCRYDDALEASLHGLDLFPDDRDLLLQRAYGLRAMGRVDQALAASKHLVQLEPVGFEGWQSLGEAFLDAGSPDSAATAFLGAMRYNPDLFESSSAFAGCEYVRGNLDRAIAMQESLSQRIDASPRFRGHLLFYQDYSWLLAYYVDAGRFAKALHAIDRAIVELGDTGVQTRRICECFRVWVLIEAGRTREVLALWRDWKDREDLNPWDTWEVEAWRAYALTKAGSLVDARVSAAKLVDPKPMWFGAYRFRAYLQLAMIDVAEAHADSALVHLDLVEKRGLVPASTYHWNAKLLRAEALALQGRNAEALAQCDAVVRQYGGLSQARYERARIEETMGRREAALADYDKFLEFYAHADRDAPLLRIVRERRRLLLANH